MRVAIPTWSGTISPVFDVANRLLVVDVEGATEVARREMAVEGRQIASRVRRVADLGVEVLICGAISKWMLVLLRARGIHAYPFVAGDVEKVIAAHHQGRLGDPEFAMPGYRRPPATAGERWPGRTESRAGL